MGVRTWRDGEGAGRRLWGKGVGGSCPMWLLCTRVLVTVEGNVDHFGTTGMLHLIIQLSLTRYVNWSRQYLL